MKRRNITMLAVVVACLGAMLTMEPPITVVAMETEYTRHDVSLIPLEVLFGDPDRSFPQLSPDGKYFTYVAPYEGVANIWIRTVGADDDRPLTTNTDREIWSYQWAFNSEQVIYRQDREGDDNHRLFSVDVDSGDVKLLTPQDAEDGHRVMARIFGGIPERPDELVIGLNLRDAAVHDAYLLNVRTGDLRLAAEGERGITLYPGWLVDWELNVRGYVRSELDGSLTLMLREGNKGPFAPVLKWSAEDSMASRPIGFASDSRDLYLLDSTGRNTCALVRWNPSTSERTLLASDPQYDIQYTSANPSTHDVDAVAIAGERVTWRGLDSDMRSDLDFIQSEVPCDIWIHERSRDDLTWLLFTADDDHPAAYRTYERDAGKTQLLFYLSEAMQDQPLVPMRPISFAARDGLTIHGYLSLPLDWEAPGPTVLKVHGGPWTRDYWGLDPETQWLANRGYAVLQVNFRGSTGYGKDFLNAGNREWGRKMQDDLTDAVRWAIAEGIADPERVAIFGMSYGGYTVLCGLAFTPDLYACGVDMFGPSSLITNLANLPPYQANRRHHWDQRVGRIPRYTKGEHAGALKPEEEWTEEERAEVEFLRSRSPLYFADNIIAPLLVAQGANDSRVKQSESDQIVEALQAQGVPVEYVVYEDEGHGFYRPENRLDFYRRAERFLAEHLGGRYEQ